MAAIRAAFKRFQRCPGSFPSPIATSQKRYFVLRSWSASSSTPAPIAMLPTLSGMPLGYSDLPAWGDLPSVEMPSGTDCDVTFPEGNGSGGAPMEAVKRTYHPHVVRKKRKHGFLHRNATTAGRRVLSRRARKGRKYVSV